MVGMNGRVARAGMLFALAMAGCASGGIDLKRLETASQVDIVVLTTDKETTNEVLQRLRDVEVLPTPRAGAETWSRGLVTGLSNGDVYTILVGQAGEWDDAATETITRRAIEVWRPRYFLVLGTALAVANDSPLGAVGVVILICDFDVDRFEDLRDTGRCYRSDGGLVTAALSVTDQWEAASENRTDRSGCAPARVIKLVALSGDEDPAPSYVETVTTISEEIHRGLIMEREGVFAAKAVADLRHEMQESVGFLMIRGISEIRATRLDRDEGRQPEDAEQRMLQEECAARDTADFAVELIRQRWPVSSRAAD